MISSLASLARGGGEPGCASTIGNEAENDSEPERCAAGGDAEISGQGSSRPNPPQKPWILATTAFRPLDSVQHRMDVVDAFA